MAKMSDHLRWTAASHLTDSHGDSLLFRTYFKFALSHHQIFIFAVSFGLHLSVQAFLPYSEAADSAL
ncbi:hypothetical protein Xbed_03131 [Xenorhabdus beddingii]|uniref:Uncharacterized protein n=1 Tax=Xenorhabdus beddingii TaxID=40578 RepID=A0A1Y2SKM8_9GAMM|nr:hypothetical protein Xbed_03131 [Xenorhabdus beddingii]